MAVPYNNEAPEIWARDAALAHAVKIFEVVAPAEPVNNVKLANSVVTMAEVFLTFLKGGA